MTDTYQPVHVPPGPKRCLQSLLVVAAFLTVEVNVFFLKYALWVPPPNPLNVARLVLWLLVGAPAVREYYEFIQGHTGSSTVALAGGVVFHKLGTFAWIAIAVGALMSGCGGLLHGMLSAVHFAHPRCCH